MGTPEDTESRPYLGPPAYCRLHLRRLLGHVTTLGAPGPFSVEGIKLLRVAHRPRVTDYRSSPRSEQDKHTNSHR